MPTPDPRFGAPPLPWDTTPYAIERLLTQGCLGEVMLARTHGGSPERLVSLRQVSADCVDDVTEALRAATALPHDARLARAHALTRVEDAVYVVGDYVRGLPALEVTRLLHAASASLTQEVATRITLDVLETLVGLHGELSLLSGMADPPRCLYPDVVWLLPNGGMMFTDSGLCDALRRSRSARQDPWLAPEQTEGTALDARSDVFAASAFCFELLSGRRFPGAELSNPRELWRSTKWPAPITEALTVIVLRALSPNPNERFATAAAMASALRQLPEHWIASRERVRAFMEPLVRIDPALDDASELVSGEHPIADWEAPTRSLKLLLRRSS